MLKILEARLQQYVNREFQMFKLDLEKAEEPEIKLLTFVGISKMQEFKKIIYFCFIHHAKAIDCEKLTQYCKSTILTLKND